MLRSLYQVNLEKVITRINALGKVYLTERFSVASQNLSTKFPMQIVLHIFFFLSLSLFLAAS